MKIKVKNSGIVTLIARSDRRGDLFAAEARKDIPFPIKRVYFINNIKDISTVRGRHAHKKTAQVFFCISGFFVMGLDDGVRKQKVLLDSPTYGVIVGPKLWHTMSKFSKNCVLLVFASEYYNERDYIRSYPDFLKYIKTHASKK